MRRSTRQMTALATVSAALLVAALWSLRGQRDEWARMRLLPVPPAAITQIALDLPGLPAQRYVMQGGQWWHAGVPMRRAAGARARSLARIAAAPVLRWLPRKGLVPGRLSLAPPLAVLWLNGTRLAFGALAPMAPERYVQLPDGRVALIPARYSPYIGTSTALAPTHAGTP